MPFAQATEAQRAVAPDAPLLLLAPMEGLLDATLRDVLTRAGGIDRCVSEFIRITDTLLPHRAFVRVVPELRHHSRTHAGVPVRPQLLGSDPVCLAENAARLAELGPEGIDLNFGCPARTVNQSRGGAVLLDEPELVGRIVAAVRRAVPAHLPVSAKMRLGYQDDRRAEECALAIAQAGASELVVHARTKVDGYRPPAYWERIADLKACLKGAAQPRLVANGEIWSVEDAWRCQRLSGCRDLMIGRGMVSHPGLARAIRGTGDVAWEQVLGWLSDFWALVCLRVDRRHRAGRLKQWLGSLRRHYPQAGQAFDTLRLINDPDVIAAWLHSHATEGSALPPLSHASASVQAGL
jgi:tRNA-dihydrouridine synthase C